MTADDPKLSDRLARIEDFLIKLSSQVDRIEQSLSKIEALQRQKPNPGKPFNRLTSPSTGP